MSTGPQRIGLFVCRDGIRTDQVQLNDAFTNLVQLVSEQDGGFCKGHLLGQEDRTPQGFFRHGHTWNGHEGRNGAHAHQSAPGADAC